MATRQYSVKLPGFPGTQNKYLESYYNVSNSSPRVNGKLVFQSNTHTFLHSRVTMYTNVAQGKAYLCQGTEAAKSYPFGAAETNQVYAKFVGKLRTGSASLGVTAASWGQSSSMIMKRLGQINSIFRRAQRKRNRNPRKKKFSSKMLASDFLEGEFGWVPLLGDIHAVLMTVCQKAFPKEWVRASSKFTYINKEFTGGTPEITSNLSGWGRVTSAARVTISNPNLWLANRLGVVNPLVVAWDLVPWSFVVNMFVNLDKIMGSLTDTLGLTLDNGSTTSSYSVLMEQRTYTRISSSEAYSNFSNVNFRGRSRVAGTIPRPRLQFKVPKVNFELAAIAAALTRQRVGNMR
jgi:hypothetical protein